MLDLSRDSVTWPNVKHEARLTGSVLAMQDKGVNHGESFKLRAGQPLLSMRLLGAVVS